MSEPQNTFGRCMTSELGLNRTSGLDVREISKIRTVRIPNIFPPGLPTFSTGVMSEPQNTFGRCMTSKHYTVTAVNCFELTALARKTRCTPENREKKSLKIEQYCLNGQASKSHVEIPSDNEAGKPGSLALGNAFLAFIALK